VSFRRELRPTAAVQLTSSRHQHHHRQRERRMGLRHRRDTASRWHVAARTSLRFASSWARLTVRASGTDLLADNCVVSPQSSLGPSTRCMAKQSLARLSSEHSGCSLSLSKVTRDGHRRETWLMGRSVARPQHEDQRERVGHIPSAMAVW